MVESNTTTSELFIDAAREENLLPVLIAINPFRYPYLEKMNIDVFQTDTNDLKSIIECVGTIKRKYNVVGICSSSEYYIEIAARVACYFNLPAADPEAVKNCRDKSKQRKMLKDSGIMIPGFYPIINMNECSEVLEGIKFPVVVKPAFGSGSIGVKLCENADQAFEHCSTLLKQTTNERGIPLIQKVLIEEYIDGPEYSVETFNGKIIGITKKHVSDPPYFIETGHDFPCESLSDAMVNEIEITVSATLKTLGLNWGPVHTELKISGGKAIIIEVNPRLAGGFIPSLINLSYGIDLIKETIKLWAGREVILNKSKSLHASLRFLIPLKSGKFIRVENFAEIQSVDNVYETKLYKDFGADLIMNGDFRDRIGHIIVYGNDSINVIPKSEDLIKQLKVIVN
jgi:biotin carboxylase